MPAEVPSQAEAEGKADLHFPVHGPDCPVLFLVLAEPGALVASELGQERSSCPFAPEDARADAEPEPEPEQAVSALRHLPSFLAILPALLVATRPRPGWPPPLEGGSRHPEKSASGHRHRQLDEAPSVVLEGPLLFRPSASQGGRKARNNAQRTLPRRPRGSVQKCLRPGCGYSTVIRWGKYGPFRKCSKCAAGRKLSPSGWSGLLQSPEKRYATKKLPARSFFQRSS